VSAPKRKEERSALARALLFFFFPPKCALCKARGWGPLCANCREALDLAFDPQSFRCAGGNGFADDMLRLFPYDDPAVKPLLFDWKMQDYEDLHQIFSAYMERAREKELFPKGIDLIAFCPRRNSARRRAGFDQGEAIARTLASVLQVPFAPLLKRRGFSRPQHKTRGEQREENVRGVFQATSPLQGETVLLVDDIVTTGASAREAARILKGAGAMKVYVFCLAHG